MAMLAFHGDESIKAKYLARVRVHAAAYAADAADYAAARIDFWRATSKELLHLMAAAPVSR